MNQAVQTLGKCKQNARRFVLITRSLTAYRSCDGRVLLQRSHSIVGCVFFCSGAFARGVQVTAYRDCARRPLLEGARPRPRSPN